MPKTIHPYFKQRISDHIKQGSTSPFDILKLIEKDTPENLYDEIPSLRTIQRHVKEIMRDKAPEYWQITNCDNPEDAQIVLRHIRAVVEHRMAAGLKLRVPRFSQSFADMLIRVHKAVPDIRPTDAMNAALGLLRDSEQERDEWIYFLATYDRQPQLPPDVDMTVTCTPTDEVVIVQFPSPATSAESEQPQEESEND